MAPRVMLVLVTGFAAAVPGSLAGQTVDPPVVLESRVRVTTAVPRGSEFVGTVSGWDGQSLSLSGPEYQDQTIPLSDLAKLEISQGVKGNAGKGALFGAGVGLVVGIVGVALYDAENDSLGLARFSILAYSTLGGTALGAVTGAFVKTEKWEEVPLAEAPCEPPGSRRCRSQ